MSCSSVALLVALTILVMSNIAAEATNTKFVSSACNTKKIPQGSPFFNNLRDMIEDMRQNTAYSGYDYKTSRLGSGGAPTAYGRAICKQSISQSDCTSCISNVGNRIYGICKNAVGARVQLAGCYLQYEQHRFY